MVRVPVRVPPAVGVNVTLTAQLEPAAIAPFAAHVVPLEAIAKSPALAPAIAIEAIVRFALPLFDMVTVSAALVLPTVSL
jgi:hypothetical protein